MNQSALPSRDEMAKAKALFRKHARRKRREAAMQLGDVSRRVARRFLDGFALAPGAVSFYWPMGDEIDPRPLVVILRTRGWRACLPAVVSRDEPLAFRAWDSEETPPSGAYGIPEPDSGAEPVLPDLVLTPLLAFDAACHRLGQGAGYYDRTLSHLRWRAGAERRVMAVGLAYEAQHYPSVPVEAHDVALDAVVSEHAIYRRK